MPRDIKIDSKFFVKEPRSKATVNNLSSFQFGKVYLAQYQLLGSPKAQMVAVKTLRLNSSPADREDFLGEAAMMLALDHPVVLTVR